MEKGEYNNIICDKCIHILGYYYIRKQMKYNKDELSIENGLRKEWLITNGIGGYSSSTIIGANTRKYHGLLVAPLMPPGNRQVILSKLDESVEIENKKYNLYTNVCENYISDGYKNLVGFEKEYIPIFTYQVEDMHIKKFICMEYGKNTIGIYYYIQNGHKDSKLTLTPIVNFRGFHTTNTSDYIDLKQEKEVNSNKVKLIINNNSQQPVYTYVSEGKYIQYEHDMFRNMYYIEEEKRGQGAKENHVVPGSYEIEIKANEEKTITFICSLEQNIEEIDAKELINKEIIRLSTLIYNTDLLEEKRKETKNEEYKNLIKNFIIATDNFVVYRPSFALYTIIAGYPWFLDWGRDTLISFEGILLKTKRFEEAKEVLLTCIRDIKYGLVPNRIFWL